MFDTHWPVPPDSKCGQQISYNSLYRDLICSYLNHVPEPVNVHLAAHALDIITRLHVLPSVCTSHQYALSTPIQNSQIRHFLTRYKSTNSCYFALKIIIRIGVLIWTNFVSLFLAAKRCGGFNFKVKFKARYLTKKCVFQPCCSSTDSTY